MLLYIKAMNQKCELHFEDGSKMVVNDKVENYLQWLCECYGSTLKGRKKVVCNLLNIKQLPPILIKDNASMILISVRDKNNDDWYYFNYEAIIDIKEKQGNSKVIFINGLIVEFSCSSRSLKKQRERCVILKNTLLYRQNNQHLNKL